MSLWEGESHLAFGIGVYGLSWTGMWCRNGMRQPSCIWSLLLIPLARMCSPQFSGRRRLRSVQRSGRRIKLWCLGSLCNSNCVGAGVNTQFFWCADGPPAGFWTSVPILCFDLSAVREQYAWSDAANKFAQECILRLDAGEDPHTVQYSIVRERAPGLPWASYGGTPAVVSQYVELGQGEPPATREFGMVWEARWCRRAVRMSGQRRTR